MADADEDHFLLYEAMLPGLVRMLAAQHALPQWVEGFIQR